MLLRFDEHLSQYRTGEWVISIIRDFLGCSWQRFYVFVISGERGLRTHRPGSNPKTTPLFMSVEFFFGFVGFSSGTPVSPSPKKPTLPNSNSI